MSLERPIRSLTDSRTFTDEVDPEEHRVVSREWLVTNGSGGYASGSITGVLTRRFHGLLVAALPAPRGRTMMLNYLAERVTLGDGRVLRLGAQPPPDRAPTSVEAHLSEFRLEWGLPVWVYEDGEVAIERRLSMVHGQNTVHVTYRLLRGDTARVELQPWLCFRAADGSVEGPPQSPYALRVIGQKYEVSSEEPDLPPLRLQLLGAAPTFVIGGSCSERIRYSIEASRGYDAIGSLYSPGHFAAELAPHVPTTLIASTEAWEAITAVTPDVAQSSERIRRSRLLAIANPQCRAGLGAELVMAADQFVITPVGRTAEVARAQATGDYVRTVIAGYPWFNDWGRDTMISLEGLTLVTGRHREAGFVLRTFAHYVKDGLIPNMFPEKQSEGLYHTADATLWFFHAIDRYVDATGDREIVAQLLPKLVDIVERHLQGTRFGIKVDPTDGLLRQGAAGYQLTWMDAKVGDLVVTPRRGKAVEINALYYNALRLLEGWLREAGDEMRASSIGAHASRAAASFNRRFWYEQGGYLYDVVDGEDGRDDASFRPNQIFPIALRHPVLERPRWKPVVEKVRAKLLTPVGLRSLAPDDPEFKPKYFGDLRSRDLAYHQGTVWAWLLGPFIDAWLATFPDDRAGARAMLGGIEPMLDGACVGTISEIFDAEPPFVARGCVAQAWSVAEVLRALVKTAK